MQFKRIFVFVITLISIVHYGVRADMILTEIESALKYEITTDKIPIRINPDGPLNFLRGYIYQKIECMYNKRFFAPDIDTSYMINEEELEAFDQYDTCEFTRNEQGDKAYKELPENKMDDYTEKYHNHLIELFPSPTGDITIETRGNQSFVQFLRAETTKERALQILAMLLLFSEGVNIPIDVSNKELKVYETNKKDKIYFTVSMVIPWFNREENETKRFEQKKVKQMIKFFQKSANNQKVLSMMEDKCSLSEIKKGKFMDSLKFLIQSYIFGFIDSADRATELIQAVYAMTQKYAPKTEAPSKNGCVYDRLFKPSGTAVGIECMALMKESQDILNTYRVFPFLNSTEVPAYKSVPKYNREAKVFSTNRLEDYSNCVESMILSLFCCLTYDPSDITYRTDHMGHVSEELEEFFSLDNQPFDTTKGNFQKEWCRVVADLKDPNIAYCNGRNEIDTGLINMLLVIAEVINAPEQEKAEILGFSRDLKEKNGELDGDLLDRIEAYTEVLLTYLTRSENVRIEFSELKGEKYQDGRCDISGEITMTFEHNGIKNTIVLGISEGHGSIEMLPTVIGFKDERMEKLNEISDSCRNVTGFVENLFVLYVNYEMRKIGSPEDSKKFMKEQVRETIQNNFTDINRLLLVRKITNLEYKRDLVTCCIVYTMDQTLSPEHPIIRFTSNIIGSTELDNPDIQCTVLSAIMLAGLHIRTDEKGASFYPRLNLVEDTYKYIGSYPDSEYCIEYLGDCSLDIFLLWFRYFLVRFYPEASDYHPFTEPTVNRSICQLIFKDGTMAYSDAIDALIMRTYPEDAETIIQHLHFIWIAYISAEENLNIELFKENFRIIRRYKYITTPKTLCLRIGDTYNQIMGSIKYMQNCICNNDEDMLVFNTLVSFINEMMYYSDIY
ncbi:uncharacterized protein NESG_00657 [Nematocida ausubeli]|uniref:Uncharacterized protein n=1 Tax=Nematocida ausubeli (strain ATCC PRA-371 / ERTm2) TaxID=1913371 RepID=A0A086J2Z1_NEMA1|nr:uncharacterized protein NESG_00657 [Nematocida ausubeli]KFG26509.1 hypothetical protein NESG_00657 [Nematocida ausubeli]